MRELGLLLAAVLASTRASGLPEVRFLAPPDGEVLPAGTPVELRGNALGFAGEPLDVVFALDASGSMRAPAAGLPPGTTRLAVAVDGLLALAASALEAGIETHTVAIPDADARLLAELAEAGGGVATASLTLYGTPEPTPLACCLLGLAALARRRAGRGPRRGGRPA